MDELKRNPEFKEFFLKALLQTSSSRNDNKMAVVSKEPEGKCLCPQFFVNLDFNSKFFSPDMFKLISQAKNLTWFGNVAEILPSYETNSKKQFCFLSN